MDRIIEMEIDLYQAEYDDHHTETLQEEYERLKEEYNEISEQCEQKSEEYYWNLGELHELYRKREEIKEEKKEHFPPVSVPCIHKFPPSSQSYRLLCAIWGRKESLFTIFTIPLICILQFTNLFI